MNFINIVGIFCVFSKGIDRMINNLLFFVVDVYVRNL